MSNGYNNQKGGQQRPFSGNRPISQQGGYGSATETITAPYNFVPLSRFVFFPDWAESVSHDVPFSDGVSGTIECELTAESPFYVRNGGYWEREDIVNKDTSKEKYEAHSFFKVGEQYVIPGTSLKGMLRNVVEIISFGKIGRRVVDNRYGVRDLRNRKLYTDHLTMSVGGAYRPQPKAAWLSLDKETREWLLTPCEFARVEQSHLTQYHGATINLNRKQDVTDKYDSWKKPLNINFDCDSTESPYRHQQGRITLLYRKVKQSLGQGPHTGTIVFTGQPGPAKHMEFIFFNEQTQACSVPKKVREEFIFIHSDAGGSPNKEWGHWEQKLRKGERVPVFFKGDPGSVDSMGLALMYRLPYLHSIRQAVGHTSPDHFHPDLDLAETIFGCLPDGKDDRLSELKGRVSVLPAVAIVGTVKELPLVCTVLGAPKPTYYPNYVKQAESKDGTLPDNIAYKSYMDKDAEIRGWKRYPARSDDKLIDPPAPLTENVATKFIPLDKGAQFRFSLRVHNLRPAELGAILWALDLGENAALRHSLGMGKSLGYGQVGIKVVNSQLASITGEKFTPTVARTAFSDLMNRQFKGEWLKSEQMEQFLAMADPSKAPQCASLQHMTLAPNQFVSAKGGRDSNKKVLLPHAMRAARKDEERFQGLKPRPKTVEKLAAVAEVPVTAVSPTPAPVPDSVVWPSAQLGFNPGTRLLTAMCDGKQAEIRLEGDAAELVSEEVINRLRKGKAVLAAVTVEPVGGGRFRIVSDGVCTM